MSLFELPIDTDATDNFSPEKEGISLNSKQMSTGAPLEQHIKEKTVDGIKYKVIREDAKPPKPGTDEDDEFKKRVKASI